MKTPLTEHAGIEVPLVCGAMYPCSNPELVAAVSEAGGIGIVQPISLTWVHGHDFREGLRLIRRLTAKPIGMNALIEQSSRAYRERMERWIDVALEEGVRFFVTSLGNPRWVVDRVSPAGGVVYHDVTERKWAEKGIAGGVHGLIGGNDRETIEKDLINAASISGLSSNPLLQMDGDATAQKYKNDYLISRLVFSVNYLRDISA